MKKTLRYLIAMMCCCASCSKKQEFKVEAEIPRVGTQELTVIYTTPTGDRAVMAIPAIGGRFEFSGECQDSADVEIFSANKQLLAAFGVRLNDDLKLKADGDSLWFDGLTDRKILRKFEVETDTATRFFPELELIVGYDTLAQFEPEGVWFFSSNREQRTEAFIDSVKSYDQKKVRDVYVSADLREWIYYCRADSMKCRQALMPDAPLKLEGILTSIPCLIEVDSLGTILRFQRLE